jgi:D-alanine-D-alanine ligase
VKKKMRVLLMTHQEFEPPDNLEGLSEKDVVDWKTEYDVLQALEELGHQTRVLGAATEIAAVRTVLGYWKPDIVFNLLEEFRGEEVYVPYVLGYLQLLGQPFTGSNPSSLLLIDNKPLTKKVLRYHRIPVPDFALFPRGKRVRRPRRLEFPLIVKSSTMHGSVGIAQKSVVNDDTQLEERVRHVHEALGTEAIAEEYVDGRELYVGVIGNRRLQTLPVWEMRFENLAEGAHAIATEKVKWDPDYQKKRGIDTGAAEGLPDDLVQRIHRLCRRVYRILDLNGYARMDFRLRDDGKLFLLEANPNPDLAHDEDFAESARAAGIPYDRLIARILNLALRHHEEGR